MQHLEYTQSVTDFLNNSWASGPIVHWLAVEFYQANEVKKPVKEVLRWFILSFKDIKA